MRGIIYRQTTPEEFLFPMSGNLFWGELRAEECDYTELVRSFVAELRFVGHGGRWGSGVPVGGFVGHGEFEFAALHKLVVGEPGFAVRLAVPCGAGDVDVLLRGVVGYDGEAFAVA